MVIGYSLALLAVSHAMGSVALCHVPKSKCRQLFGLSTESLVIYSIFHRDDVSFMRCIGPYVGWYQAILLLHFNFLLNIHQYQPRSKQSYMNRVKQSLSQMWNPRGIGTTWGHCKRPTAGEYATHNKAVFLIQRTLSAALALLILYAWDDGAKAPRYFNFADFTPEKQHLIQRFHEVTWRELQARCALTVISQIYDYSFITWIHSVLSVIGVLFLGHDTEAWPDLFGDITEAYTIRRAWV
ncbi:hypothetical protein BGW36DRAFT_359659 [Talaromyces proteolyticus]|uniref:Wax synthase domain-containing protein n=1 Tax=Talaromyces proteolyticus TaxID=1131652 RepID=A0AAD4KVR6_9EURO|nr:uncharacterized protein BGW36DRAFT_359659 [Talaromyces proteolyticus]KAH8697885.1 hypothetical protein BGW36DRAFT_359659 [Talaromyces proteolyticus]